MRDAFKLLELRLRALAPRSIRQIYRMGRSLAAEGTRAPSFPVELTAGSEVCASRYDMLRRLPKGGIVAELGTETGKFASQILSIVEPDKLHVVDLDYRRFDQSLSADPRLVQHTGMTYEIISRFPDQHFDWVYIDADHSYRGVLRDARASSPKIKPGGLMIFNDFAHIDPNLGRYGVMQAATEFAVEAKWPLRYFALEPSALYDVAFRKPGG
ncbi:MAG: class I SAM-dependent methyltransferase [Hyphomicrobium sp.]|nr:class I SAM-dependent methyltransferase [Hyphomicrobium sp.]